MRWSFFLLLCAGCQSTAPIEKPPENAETLFRKVEKKLEESKAVSAKFRLTCDGEEGQLTIEGRIRWKGQDPFEIHVDAHGKMGGEKQQRTVHLRLDGKTLCMGQEKGAAPKGYVRILAASMVRSGFFPVASGQLQFFPTPLGDERTLPDEVIRVSNFGYGVPEEGVGSEHDGGRRTLVRGRPRLDSPVTKRTERILENHRG